MTNLFRNKSRCHQLGAVTLILTVTLLTVSTLIILFAANYGVMRDKMVSNLSRNQQALNAAEAGLEFGINYLKINQATILANPVNGFIQPYSDTNTTNIALANNSKFTVVYTNPVANNYSLVTITSTGVSDDGSATHIAKQSVYSGSLLLSPPTIPLTTKGDVSMTGSSQIVNTFNGITIQSGDDVTMAGASKTVLSSGVSSKAGNIKADVQSEVASLANQSQNDFFSSIFGTSSSTIQSNVAHYYSNNANTNYSATLNGMTNTSIWIDQTGGTATINGNTTIGSSANPVLLIVNGNLSLSGNVTIYGFIFVIGTNDITSLTGNTGIVGGMATSDDINISGNNQITYDPNVLKNLQSGSSLRYYAKVPGSWRDY